MNLGIAAYRDEDYTLAEKIFAECTTSYPSHMPALRYLALSQIRQGKLDDALINLEKIISLDPKYGKAYLDIAEIQIKKGNLNEAAKRGTVVAFTGNPHVMNKKAQLIKSLTAIGFEQYYQAEQKGWVLYLEGATDLAILEEFALKLNHPAKELLDDAFVHYVENNLPQEARNHFYALQEAISDLTGIAIFDKLDKELHQGDALIETQWHKKEIENYLFIKDIFYSYILEGIDKLGLFAESERKKRIKAMDTAFEEVHKALKTFGKDNLLPDELKVSDEFIEPLFRIYSEKMGIPLTLRKSDFYKLIKYIPVG